ncbi:hypothetical protein [Spiroplasma turonicum]|uniref:Transmembrane protein n=1 Tax=Spiroplasma turonicum TaxID=216946 RepID=A0A0K1P7M2_9MOLU|nr:hypothetical protein [Spiroplasma turonicum]AKU80285.1 hypothetical protein STURON_001039 [Spiroplasma turonicum]ALX71286.1 hypothetical protein STURO_v1c10350 [Spiroplasma turonicum]
MWGESNTRNFIDWADICQSSSLRSRSIKSLSSFDYKANLNSETTRNAMHEVLEFIKQNKTMSIQHFYNTAPAIYASNPTTKYILLQLYFEDCIKLKGEIDNTNYKEKNYSMAFSKNLEKKQQVLKNNNVKQKSNIEQMIDNNWFATGRKLVFEKKDKNVSREYNISLKNNNVKTTNMEAVKPIIDVRNTIKKEERINNTVIANNVNKPEITEESKPSLKYISIPKPTVEDIKPNINSSLNLTKKPETVKNNFEEESKIFAGLNSYELYFLYFFYKDLINRNIDKSKETLSLVEIIQIRADIQYTKEGRDKNALLKFTTITLCFLIIGFIFIPLVFHNKQKKLAYKDYYNQVKISSFSDVNKSLNIKYPNIVKKIY